MSLSNKRCTKCRKTKPTSEYSSNRARRDGLQSQCRQCMNSAAKEYRKAHPEKCRQICQDWREKNPERNKQLMSRWQKDNRKKGKLSRWQQHGIDITVEEYNAYFEQQNGCCKICNRHQSELKRALNVDHDHETGKIRGLLCNECNLGLGKFKDDLDLIYKACIYLQEYRG